MGQTSRDPLYKRSSAHRALVTALIDHFGLLHDYTRTLNPGFTTGLTLYVVIFQAFTINRPLDYALDSLGLNELSASIIVVLLISVPIFLLISTVAFIIMETRVKRRLDNLPDEVHAHSAWYTIYAYVYRFSFFVTEPATTGFVLSAWAATGQDYQTKQIFGELALIILSIITPFINCQSLLYVHLVESVLPSNTILSATSKTHIWALNLMQKVGLFTDSINVYISSSTDSSSTALLTIVTILRVMPSIVTLSLMYHGTYFFSQYGRYLFGALHSIIIFLTACNLAIFFMSQSRSTLSDLLIPLALAGSAILKITWNLARRGTFRPISPQNCDISEIIEAAELSLLINEDEDDEQGRAAVLLAQVEAHLSSSDKSFWHFHKSSLEVQSQHSKAISFVLYLFKTQMMTHSKSQVLLKLYLAYYTVRLRMSMLRVNRLLQEMQSTNLSMSNMIILESIKRMVACKMRDYSEGKVTFINGISTSYVLGLDSRVAKEHDPSVTTAASQLAIRETVNFYKAFYAFKAHKKIIDRMNSAIDECLDLYELNDKNYRSNSSIHQHCSNIVEKIHRVRQTFVQIEGIGFSKYRFHYLPYGMFLDNLANDRFTLLKMLKQYQEKAKVSFQQFCKFMHSKDIKNLSAKQTVIFRVSAAEENLGQIVEASRNFQPIFGIPWNQVEGRNISELVSEEFSATHHRMLRNLAQSQDRPYLDLSKHRYARISGSSAYTKVSMVTRIYPRIDEGLNFISMMRKDEAGQSFLVVSSNGTLLGYGHEICFFLPQVAQLIGEKLSAISEDLQTMFGSLAMEQLLLIKSMDREQIERVINSLGIIQSQLRSSTPGQKVEVIKISSSNSMVNTNVTLESTVFKKAAIRINDASLVPVYYMGDGTHYFEAILHLDLQKVPHAVSKQTFKNTRDVDRQNTLHKTFGLLKSDSSSLNESDGDDILENLSHEALYIEDRSPVGKQNMPIAKLVKKMIPKSINPNNADDERKKMMENHNLVERMVLATVTKSEEEYDRSSLSSTHKLKNKINTVVRKQTRQLIWKEMSGILFVQIVVWATCIYITVLLHVNFYTELKNLINLRKGILFFTLANTNCWSTSITLFDEMLVKGGWLAPHNQRHQFMLPYYDYEFSKIYPYQFAAAQNYSQTFIRHVYSFQWDFASRYFINKANYTYQLSDYDNTTLATQTYDFSDLYRVALGAIRRWSEYIGNKTTIVSADFDIYPIKDYLMSIGQGILEKIGTPTILLLLDTDYKSYNSLISSVRLIIIFAIVISLVLSNAILFIVYVVRNKISTLYSAFQRLSLAEVAEERNMLFGMKRALDRSTEYEEVFLEEFHRQARKRNVIDISYQNANNLTKYRVQKKSSHSFFNCKEFYGLLNFVLVMFVIMEAFNITTLNLLSTISDQTNRKLDMLTMSRSTISGSAALHSVTYRAYAMSIQQAGLGLKYYNRTQMLTLMTNSRTSLQTLFRFIEDQLDNKFEPFPDQNQVGWDKFRHSSPCDYVNKPVFNLTQDACGTFASGLMAKTPSDMYRWFRYALDEVLFKVRAANKSNALNVLSSPEFTEFNFLRRVFAVPFILNLNFDFYKKLENYHEDVAFITRRVLTIFLIGSVLVAFVLNVIGFQHMRKQVRIGLSSLSLLPSSSFSRNPHITAMLQKLS